MSEKIEKNLKAMYRITCPDSHTLGEFKLGILTSEAAQPIVAHIEICPLCRQELELLNNYLASPPNFEPQENPTSKNNPLQTLIAKLIPPPLASVGIRGDQEDPLVFETGGWQITIDIQKDINQPGHLSLLGLISGGEFTEGKVKVWQEKELIAQTPIDSLGNFTFSGLEVGKYTISFILSSVKIQVDNVIL